MLNNLPKQKYVSALGLDLLSKPSVFFFSPTRSYITKCICFRNNNNELCYIETYYSVGIVPDTFHELAYTHPVR